MRSRREFGWDFEKTQWKHSKNTGGKIPKTPCPSGLSAIFHADGYGIQPYYFFAISLAAAKEFTLKPTDHANTKNIPGNLFCIFFTSWSLLVFRCRLISIYKLTQWNHLLYQVVSAKHYIYSLIVPYSFCYINTQHVIIRPYDSIPGGVLPCTP